MPTLANVTELQAALAEAALELGDACTIYRATSPLVAAFDPSYLHGQTYAAFPVDYGYKRAPDPTKPARIAIVDTTVVNVKDYVKNNATGEVHFIANAFTLQPIMAINCNTLVSVYGQSSVSKPVGNVGRLGDVVRSPLSNELRKVNNWPGSLLYAGRGAKTLSNLPTDDAAPQFSVLLPSMNVSILLGDVVSADTRRFAVRAVEYNIAGIRLTCTQLVQ